MSKPVVLTGIRANNDLTLGNYFGAILPMVDMATKHAKDYQINMFVPDLHSFTTSIDHSQLQTGIWNNLRVFVAAGLPLDNPDVHLYRQSYIPAHSELTWILQCFTGFGELKRMTQFKEKSGIQNSLSGIEKLKEKISNADLSNPMLVSKFKYEISGTVYLEREIECSSGLFSYPVLMASDILLYGATYVPVGDDQTQHLEFTRDIAERMNKKFNQELFVIPKPVKEQHAFFGKDQGLRIMDLQDPTKKMSKSDELGRGVIFLSDAPEVAAKKIMSATTDSLGFISHDYDKQPGIANLMEILALLNNREVASVAQEWEGKTSYGEFKSAVAESVKAFLTVLQEKLSQVSDEKIQQKLSVSEEQMQTTAQETLHKVQKAVGLRD
jgi:tryptophanyl-tRNA synthetase